MWIDTHCHIDAAEFDPDRSQVIEQGRVASISHVVVPAVWRANFETVYGLARNHEGYVHALGIHPMYVSRSEPEDIQALKEALQLQTETTHPPVAVGEIGLDYFVEEGNKAQQVHFFVEQLALAQQFNLPVILHVRKSVDDVLKYLRRIRVPGGIAHAFNGSFQQAHQFIELGFKLGFGGAMTYERALHIRSLAKELPIEAIVLETDAPDIPPSWVGHRGRNQPAELPAIAAVLAELRGVTLGQVAEITTKNALEALPKLAELYTPPKVLH